MMIVMMIIMILIDLFQQRLQVIRDSETAMIMAQQLVTPITALGDDADVGTVYLPVEWQGMSGSGIFRDHR